MEIKEKRFHNNAEKNLTYDDVFKKMKEFVQKEPRAQYVPMIGCDSQVHGKHTLFVTVVVMRRLGKGAWYCRREEIRPRRMRLYEKLLKETLLISEVASYFTEDKKMELEDIVLPYIYKGASMAPFEGHLDAGKGNGNDTRIYVQEMSGILKGANLVPIIKPDAIASSGVANKFTKEWAH